MLYDLFICHASEDKAAFVRPLAESLRSAHVEVWYDEFSLKLGDSIRQSIDIGLRKSRFGIVVLSKAFFDKKWTQYELDGLVEHEMKGNERVILPIWHGVTHDDIAEYSLTLANRFAVSSIDGMDAVVRAILNVIRPQGSPLIIARDTLVEWGVTPPVITDEYWLHVVGASNRSPAFGATIPEESIWGRWSFPLPKQGSTPQEWGERLAWVAMQLQWSTAAEEIPISPLCNPRVVLDFIDSHPGLFEICELFPGLLAEYAPQLTIPGMGGDFEPLFEEQYQKSLVNRIQMSKDNPRFGSALTVNEISPLCDKEWSLRSPTFGNYYSRIIAYEYFHGGMFGPPVSPFEEPDHAFWLLSIVSNWLPDKIHSYLIEGIARSGAWSWKKFEYDKSGDWKSNGALCQALDNAISGESIKWTNRINDDVINRIMLTIKRLSLPDKPDDIFSRFLENKFPEEYIKNHVVKKKKRQNSKKIKTILK